MKVTTRKPSRTILPLDLGQQRTILRNSMNHKRDADELLAGIGAKIRENRLERGLTVKGLSAASELSPRFINQLEAGKANISVSGLYRIAQAFDRSLPELLSAPEAVKSTRSRIWKWISDSSADELTELIDWIDARDAHSVTPKFIALVGLRGAGKSTVGGMLSRRLKVDFVELDAWIEGEAGMSLGEIFSMHGEDYYRRLERRALDRLFNGDGKCVFAPGGSVVTDNESWNRIKRHSLTIGLHASANELMKRMRTQGDTRPMKDRPAANIELTALLARRDPLYAESDLVFKTTGKSPSMVTSEILKAIKSLTHKTNGKRI